MTAAPHKIGRQVLELVVPQEPGIRDAQEAFRDLYYAHLLPVIERVFDEMVPADRVLRLDYLELDLGKVGWDMAPLLMVEAMEESLRSQLQALLPDHGLQAASGASVEAVQLTGVDGDLQVFLYYLLLGQPPSWLAPADYKAEESMLRLLQSPDDAIIRQIRQAMVRPVVLRRLAWAFSTAAKTQLLEKLLPAQAPVLQQLRQDLTRLHALRPLLPMSHDVFQLQVWEASLGMARQATSSPASVAQVLPALLTHLLPSTVFDAPERAGLLLQALRMAPAGTVHAETQATLEAMALAHGITRPAQLAPTALQRQETIADAQGHLQAPVTEPAAQPIAEMEAATPATPPMVAESKESTLAPETHTALDLADKVPVIAPLPEANETGVIDPGSKAETGAAQPIDPIPENQALPHPRQSPESPAQQPTVEHFSKDEVPADENLPTTPPEAPLGPQISRENSPLEVPSAKETPTDSIDKEPKPLSKEESQTEPGTLSPQEAILQDPPSTQLHPSKEEILTQDVARPLDAPSLADASPNKEAPEIQAGVEGPITPETHVLQVPGPQASERIPEAEPVTADSPPEDEAHDTPATNTLADEASVTPKTRIQVEDEAPVPPNTPTEAESIADRFRRFREMWANNPEQLIPAAQAEPLHIPWRQDKAGGFEVPNAGLVLVWPYIGPLFKSLGWLEKREFVEPEHQLLAVLLLHYIATGATSAPEEHALGMCKVMAGLDPANPVPVDLPLTALQRQEADEMLGAVIANWAALKKTSPAGLRQMFLQRSGILRSDGQGWMLHLERGTMDVLLDRLPWGYSTIRLGWQPKMIFVEW